jgi:hypothetical protein
MDVYKQEDEYSRELWLNSALWTAELSNGEFVVQDDGRPGLKPESAWLRLGEYVRQNNLRIVGLSIRFRNEPPIVLPRDAKGYFFRKSLGAFLYTEHIFQFYIIGYLDNHLVRVSKYKVPEMILVEQSDRDAEDEGMVGPSLIRNPA